MRGRRDREREKRRKSINGGQWTQFSAKVESERDAWQHGSKDYGTPMMGANQWSKQSRGECSAVLIQLHDA